jgi:cysteine-rich repeat protein
MRTRLLAIGVLILAASAPPPASARPACTGRFLASASLAIADGTIVLAGVDIAGGQVAIAGACGPVRARMRRGPHGTIVKAGWTSCAGLPGRVRLRARIDRGCRKLAGVLRAPAADFAWAFRAARFAACGNGIREDDEACDDGNTVDGDCCSATCTEVPGSACAGTACRTNDECPAGAYCEQDGVCGGEGRCRQRSEACIGVLEPVCGCDGRTYVNACEAAAAGVTVRARGRCDRACGMIGGIACGEGEFCELEPGTCRIVDAGGTCVDVPDGCPDVYRPVCGCDGQTYGNDCDRRAARAQKAHDGPCRCPEIRCAPGTRAVDRDGDGCPDTCLAPCRDACDCYENPDLVFPRPCPLECATCDNYWVCEDGFCQDHCGPVPLDDVCRAIPCKENSQCGDAEYCAKPPGRCDGEGICQPRFLPCPAIIDPVCGCDGQSYGSACEAAAAGVNVAHRGPCGAECGTIVGLPCPDGEFCEFPPGTCDVADGGGTCTEVPRVCPDLHRPVCGCDGTTYGNDCERRAAAAQLAHHGPCACPPIVCPPGVLPHDTDGDGCVDTCRPEGCAPGDECGRGSYCAARPGQCHETGVCAERPPACPRIYAPVCGCDGRTYASECVAAAEGVRVAAPGSCGPACADDCDCVGLPFGGPPCAVMCPTCGPFWTCEGGRCVEQCGPMPLERDCSVPGTPPGSE